MQGIMKTLIGLIEALKNIRKAQITYSTKTLNRDNIMKALIDEGYTIETRIVHSIGRNVKDEPTTTHVSVQTEKINVC